MKYTFRVDDLAIRRKDSNAIELVVDEHGFSLWNNGKWIIDATQLGNTGIMVISTGGEIGRLRFERIDEVGDQFTELVRYQLTQ